MPRPLPLLALLLAAGRAAALTPASERVFTLQDSVQLALLNDAEVLQAEQEIKIAEERVKEAAWLFLPELGVQASATRYEVDQIFAVPQRLGGTILSPGPVGLSLRQDQFSGRIYFAQTLYAGRRHVNTYKIAKVALQEAKSDYERAKMDVRSRTKQVFYELLTAQRRMDAAEQAWTEARDRSSLGGLAPLERLEAAAGLERLRVSLAESHRQAGQKRLDYLRALNLELNTVVRLEGSLEPPYAEVDLSKAVVWAMELRPELQSQVHKAQVEAIEVSLALGRRSPEVLLGGTYELLDDELPLAQHNWHASVAINFPIAYNFWSQLRSKRAEQRQGRLRRASLQDQVRLEVRDAYDDAAFWREERSRREEVAAQLRDLYASAARGSFGPRTLAARISLLDAELALIEAQRRQLLAIARLERSMGRDLD